jgi:anaerobic selenocysteine-containing dehydrogenase
MSSTATPNLFAGALSFLRGLMNPDAAQVAEATPAVEARPQMRQPVYSESSERPKLLTIKQPDGRISQYPPSDRWDDWVEYDSKSWPKRVARRYTLVPTICFNCEAACGLLAYVDQETGEIRKFEGNPAHPGSRGRNCAKGPATHNQVYDPERILYPLKRVGEARRGQVEARLLGRGDRRHRPEDAPVPRQAARRHHVPRGAPRRGRLHQPDHPVLGRRRPQQPHQHLLASARTGYAMWSGADRPSPDYANAQAIVLISAHLESGHYFNPHAQRIMEAKAKGAKIICFDPRLSNTAARSDFWLPTWPGSETTVLLAMANHLLTTGRWDKEFVRRWVNWETVLEVAPGFAEDAEVLEIAKQAKARYAQDGTWYFEDFERLLLALYREYTIERAAEESQVDAERIREAAEHVARSLGRVAGHTWRSATMGNEGGWQVARSLFFLSVLTGSVATEGGTGLNSWNKFVPKPFKSPPPFSAWNELHLPPEWPLAMYEMSFCLPHLLEEGRGDVDVYFTRVYNPMWINPDGFMWLKSLRDEEQIKCHVALTPTWNESAWFADYVLPMGHAGERHDIMSQETHAGQWFGFRQPVRRVAMERMGQKVDRTWEANPGEVWEEAEFWVDLSWAMDPDGELGVRQYFESPYLEGTEKGTRPITMDEYFGWIFENSVPGLPEKAEAEGLTPLAYMRKYGAFEVTRDVYQPYEKDVDEGGVEIDGQLKQGFMTPSKKLELFSPTLSDWGWREQQYCIPWQLKSHVHPDNVKREEGQMLLLPTFRLPTLIHTRSANAKWLYEISHKNPVWMHPEDAARIGVVTGDLIKVSTEIGSFVDKVWVTEGIKPGIIAMSHHLGRWRLTEGEGIGAGMSSLATLDENGDEHELHLVHGARAWKSSDPDTSRIWWEDVGVHQNLTHAVHPDPVSGAHCWHQLATKVEKAGRGDRHGDVTVDTAKSMAVFREWKAKARDAYTHSPDGTRRPYWLKRPLKPTKDAYQLPERPDAQPLAAE